jgi:hypothetical protein
MFSRTTLLTVVTFVCFAAFASVATAKAPKKNNASSTSAAAKAAAAAEAKKQADAKHTQLAQGFYNDLHDTNPNLTLGQIETMSSENIRRLYLHSYMVKGSTLTEAKAKSDALKIWD